MLTSTPTRPAHGVFGVTVSRVTRLSPSFVRVTFTGDDLIHFDDTGLDQRLKVVLPHPDHGFDLFPAETDWWTAWRGLDTDVRNTIRTYTARAIRPADREVDVDFVTHGTAGPASAWVATARPGDEMILIGPDARGGALRGGIEWNPGDASTLLLAGDETAVPAISSILSTLGQDATGCAFLEVPSAADVLPLRAPASVEVHWLPRDERRATSGELLVAAVRDWTTRFVTAAPRATPADPASLTDVDIDRDLLWEVPDAGRRPGDLYAWLAGEAAAITTLRRFLVGEVGIDRAQVAFMGYWRLGKSEN